tara:strand:+ start:62 stop:382 length:321 start_codon:yes stop_codon:yes gene_type:complete
MEIIKLLITKFDPITLGVLTLIYFRVYKKLNVLDNAVNNRKEGQNTLSQEVTEIHVKLDKVINKQIENEAHIKHTKEQVDLHRNVDEKAFNRIEKDIRSIASKVIA